MAKKFVKHSSVPGQPPEHGSVRTNINPAPVVLPQVFNFSLRTKYIFLAIVGFVFYANSILNEYAFDDNLAILKNTYVQMGFAGIPKILTSDSWASFYSTLGADLSKQQSTGGRFRPLSQIIFAIEEQLFGDSPLLPHFRHLVNVLAYVACIIAIFYFLQNFLFKKIPGGGDIAFLSALLFAVHPIHTEVVANIKSFDEILSMLFIMLTFIYSLKYLQDKKSKHLVFGTSSFFLALLSKEYAVTLIFFIPFLFYLLRNKKIVPALIAALPYYGVFAVYLALRYNAVGFHGNIQSSNLLLNPYVYATHTQKIATEWFVLGKYLGLLFFPYPLSCDYSYNQVPYHNFLDVSVILSIAVYVSVFVWGIFLALRKNILSFAMFFFLINILLISNLILNLDGTMGERLVFQSSLGLIIILSYYLFKALSKVALQVKKIIVIGMLAILGVLCFGETVIRNAEWKNDMSLFIHDTQVSPSSFMVNLNAGHAYLKLSEDKDNTPAQAQAYRDSSKKYSLRALQFFPNLDIAYHNLGDVYFYNGMLDSAGYCWDKVIRITPNYPNIKPNLELLSQIYLSKGLDMGKNGKPHEGIVYLKKALVQDSTNPSIWLNLGGAYYNLQQFDSARYAWIKTLQCDPGNAGAKNGLQALSDLLPGKREATQDAK